LPGLFAAYREGAGRAGKLDALVVMENGERGGAVEVANRGARAFADLLETFSRAFGVDVKTLASLAPAAKPMEGRS